MLLHQARQANALPPTPTARPARAASLALPGARNPAAALFDRIAMARQWPSQVKACIAEWHRRAHSRRDLMMLAERDLRDIRLTRVDVLSETSKPFWKA